MRSQSEVLEHGADLRVEVKPTHDLHVEFPAGAQQVFSIAQQGANEIQTIIIFFVLQMVLEEILAASGDAFRMCLAVVTATVVRRRAETGGALRRITNNPVKSLIAFGETVVEVTLRVPDFLG